MSASASWMRSLRSASVSLVCLFATGACTGETPSSAPARTPAIEEAGPTLQLQLGEQTEGAVEVLLGYYRRADQVGPRVIEIYLSISDNLVYESSRALEAATLAQKELTVQDRDEGLRVMLFSTASIEPLDSGFFASLRLIRKDGETATLVLQNVGDAFAPAEANAGFVPPEPLSIGGI